jgi:hypothetical protein
MLNCFLHLPCLLPMARGRVAVPAALGGVLALVFIPSLYLGVSARGAIAAAFAWLALNAVALILALAIPQQGLPWDQRWRWFVIDTGVPACGALAAILMVQAVLPPAGTADRSSAALAIALSAAGALFAAAATTSAGRRLVRDSVKGLTRGQK